MKKSLRSLLSLLMILVLLFSLLPAVFAAEGDPDADPDPYVDPSGDPGTGFDPTPDPDPEPDPDHGKGLIVPDVQVYFSIFSLPMNEGQTAMVTATVIDAMDGASYDWYCSNTGVAAIQGSKETVTVTAISAGHAEITLTVTRPDGSTDFDYFDVDVEAVSTPVSVSGGGNISLEEGESVSLQATASGGSGSYQYEWDAYGSAALSFLDRMRGNAEVYAGQAGTGTVLLTVYDAEDTSNNDTVQWTFTVSDKPAVTPPEVEMSRGTVDLGAGATGALQLAASGGSGNYEYIWRSDNASIVSVEGSGPSVTIRAADTLLPGSSTAQITAYVRDTQTGLTSNTATCVVNVTRGEATYNASASAKVGTVLDFGTVAQSIGNAYRSNFGYDPSLGASVKFQTTVSAAGAIRLSDGTAVISDSGYSYNTFLTMVFNPSAAGTFSTYYMLIDGGNTISGTITVSVSGTIPVTDVTISPTSLRMAYGSNQYLTLNVAPSNATYTVSWSSSDTRIINVVGSGTKVTLKSGNYLGTATVYAVVTDGSGKQITRSCAVEVYQDVPVYPAYNYDPSITVMMGSDYYGSKLADSLTSQFKTAYNTYPAENATIIFTSLGNARYGTMYLKDGTPAATRRNYTFRDFVDMYFEPSATGTYSIGYQMNYNDRSLQGTMSVLVASSSLTVNMTPTAVQMSPYSSQYIYLDVQPYSAYYRVSWSSTDNRVVTVSGNNTTATITSQGNGTATVYAVITDRNGVEIRRGCTVVVSSNGSVFNPSVTTTIGVPYVGTGTSSAMRSQFQAVYGMALPDSAQIRFASTGNNEVAVMRQSDGSMIRPNVDYTMGQYVSTYTQSVSAGTYSVPYTLSYAGKVLRGTVNVEVNSANVVTDLTLPSRTEYFFSDPLSGSTGAAILSNNIRNTVGSGWSYIRFASSTDTTGALFLDKNFTPLTQSTNVNAYALSTLYFVPSNQTGSFSAPFTIYSSTGAILGSGTLRITTPGVTFADVPANAYYAPAVTWAVDRGITSGTGVNQFSPNKIVTRADAMTFLWRAAGKPKVTNVYNPFTDVPTGAYYCDAVLWAVQQGITTGTSSTTFSPEKPLHRDMMLTFLCRANGGYAGGGDWSTLAVNWANTRGLLSGMPINFVPTDDCPRSEVVYYLWKNYN